MKYPGGFYDEGRLDPSRLSGKGPFSGESLAEWLAWGKGAGIPLFGDDNGYWGPALPFVLLGIAQGKGPQDYYSLLEETFKSPETRENLLRILQDLVPLLRPPFSEPGVEGAKEAKGAKRIAKRHKGARGGEDPEEEQDPEAIGVLVEAIAKMWEEIQGLGERIRVLEEALAELRGAKEEISTWHEHVRHINDNHTRLAERVEGLEKTLSQREDRMVKEMAEMRMVIDQIRRHLLPK